jgi:hypothetical protein
METRIKPGYLIINNIEYKEKKPGYWVQNQDVVQNNRK